MLTFASNKSITIEIGTVLFLSSFLASNKSIVIKIETGLFFESIVDKIWIKFDKTIRLNFSTVKNSVYNDNLLMVDVCFAYLRMVKKLDEIVRI